MSEQQRQRMVVKVGSQLLCGRDDALDTVLMAKLAGQVAALWNAGWAVLLVSSGAVAAGGGLAREHSRGLSNPVTRRQVLAATGQVRLMETWQQAFHGLGLITAQVLATRSDFQSRDHYLNMRACIEGLLDAGIIPVVNENDVVSVTELMFTDNDELAGLMAGLVGARRLCLLSAVDGVLENPDGQVIKTWDDGRHVPEELVQAGASSYGRGGMHSKIAVARKAAGLGIETVIANGAREDVIAAVARGEAVGTRFPPRGAASPAKRWLASMDAHTLGAVTVNAGAETALRDSGRLASLLPVGLLRVDGAFERGDVIQVCTEAGQVLGCGRAQYDHEQARAVMGQHGQKPLIHYDYLYLEG